MFKNPTQIPYMIDMLCFFFEQPNFHWEKTHKPAERRAHKKEATYKNGTQSYKIKPNW